MIRSFARRSPRVRALYRGLRDFVVGPDRRLLPELHRVHATRSQVSEFRLNLIINTIDPRASYAGVPTALSLFRHIAANVASSRSRIITWGALPAAPPDLDGYAPSHIDDESPQRSLVGLDETADGRLPVGPWDVFVATYWSTAESVLRVREWQRTEYGAAPRYFLYIIQDYEPGFYPHSAGSLLARSTYESTDAVIAVFNSEQLRDYFHSEHLSFAHEFAFEPRLPVDLRDVRRRTPRRRTIVVYGRPETPRNAFPLIVEALRRWHEVDPRATSWTCVSAGAAHGRVDLGGNVLRSIGKLDMAAYGELLSRSAVGIYLGVGPGAVYVPMEMAHLGMLVITNRGTVTDRASLHDNITSLTDVTPEGIAVTISEVCGRFDRDPTAGERGQTRRPEYLSDDPQFPFANEVARLLMQGPEKTGGPTLSNGTSR